MKQGLLQSLAGLAAAKVAARIAKAKTDFIPRNEINSYQGVGTERLTVSEMTTRNMGEDKPIT